MQASLHLPFLPLRPIKASKVSSFPQLVHTSAKSLRVKASFETPEVDYTSMTSSVFPAEACETLGGVACDVEMFPETKLKEEPKAKVPPTSEKVDREYLQYDSPKTVFIEEACDDLGGEFCEPAYQSEAN